MDAPDPMTLAEAVEAGMWPTLPAARKAVQRAQLEDAGWRGAAKLYTTEALATAGRREGRPMTDSDTPRIGLSAGSASGKSVTATETWKPIPGYPFYEVSDCGRVRSIPREAHGRTYRGVVQSTRVSNSGYVLVNLRDENGERQTRTVHTLVLAAFVGPRPRGQESMHLNNDPLDNRADNLAYGSHPENVEAQFSNGRPRAAEKPPKVCVRCQSEFEGSGRRCHACVVEIGEQGARLLVAGVTPDDAAAKVDYPSASGLVVLAVKYGGLRLTLAAEPAPSRSAHGPLATLRHRFRRGHSQ